MSTLALRKITKFNGSLRRYSSTFPSESMPFIPSPRRPGIPERNPIPKRPAHTHFLSIPVDNGSFFERLQRLRDYLRANASMIANLEPNMIIPNLKRTCLLRIGHVNIQGCKTNKAPLVGQPSFEFSQVEEALEKAKMRISTEISTDALELAWGQLAPQVPAYKDGQVRTPFNPGLVKVLQLRAQLCPALNSVRKIQVIVFEELESAGITNIKLRESTNVPILLINTKWRAEKAEGLTTVGKPFNIKTLYTLPGFDEFRTVPLPIVDEGLARFTPVNLGSCSLKAFVLEEVGQDIEQIDGDPVFTKAFEFA